MIRFCRLIVLVYLMLSLTAMVLVPMSSAGLFGFEPDPLSALWAVILSMPWPIVAGRFFSDTNAAFNLGILGLGMTFNALVMMGLCGVLERFFGTRDPAGR